VCNPRGVVNDGPSSKEHIMSSKLYVGNLPFSSDAAQLRNVFGEFGEVVDAVVITDRDTGRSRGFGFVEMANDSEAQSAISAMNGSDLDGRQLTVNVAKPRR